MGLAPEALGVKEGEAAPAAPPPPFAAAKAELLPAVASCRNAFVATGVFSFFINLLLFASPLYMMQVYDRVLGSRNGTTLLMLSLIVGGLLVVMGLLEAVRARILARAGLRLDELLNRRIFSAVFRRSLKSPGGVPAQALRDLDTIRDFVGGGAILVFSDAPWAPLFLGMAFILHPMLGWVSLAGALFTLSLAVLNERFTRRPLKDAVGASLSAGAFAESSLRNAEVIEAMGMMPGIAHRWLARHHKSLALHRLAGDRGGVLLAVSRVSRMLLQSAILGVGAWLCINDQLTAGAIMAGSIIMGRALAPVELAVGQWKNVVNARGAWGRLKELLVEIPAADDAMPLPAPKGALSVEGVVAAPPGSKIPALRGVSFAIEPGEVLGVVGPSAAGKSTLARIIVGVWSTHAGMVRLDGAEIARWDREALGPHLGYLPQDVELFDGSVAENIARFSRIDPRAVVKAAMDAGVHDMILHLPQGYDTRIGEGGRALSGGQRQRLGLARALYGEPKLLVLDEPNSNLDTAGDEALVAAIAGARARGAAIIVISHRISILAAVDKVMVMNAGVIELFGRRDEVLARFARATAAVGQAPNHTAVARSA